MCISSSSSTIQRLVPPEARREALSAEVRWCAHTAGMPAPAPIPPNESCGLFQRILSSFTKGESHPSLSTTVVLMTIQSKNPSSACWSLLCLLHNGADSWYDCSFGSTCTGCHCDNSWQCGSSGEDGGLSYCCYRDGRVPFALPLLCICKFHQGNKD